MEVQRAVDASVGAGAVHAVRGVEEAVAVVPRRVPALGADGQGSGPGPTGVGVLLGEVARFLSRAMTAAVVLCAVRVGSGGGVQEIGAAVLEGRVSV